MSKSGPGDYSNLFIVQRDIVQSFRTLKMQSNRMDKALKHSHNKHFRQFMKSKRENMLRQITSRDPFFDERNVNRHAMDTFKPTDKKTSGSLSPSKYD